jgi:hypothetical protein
MDQARADFHRLASGATPTDLRRRSDGTRWTNRQLLFHMMFGYLVVRALLVLVRVFGVLPDGASKIFARILDAAHRPFHLINYLGSCAGGRIIPPRRMTGMLDRVIAALGQRLRRESEAALRRGMHCPTAWDPFFTDYMTLADIYRYPTRHFRCHQSQLTLGQIRRDLDLSGSRVTEAHWTSASMRRRSTIWPYEAEVGGHCRRQRLRAVPGAWHRVERAATSRRLRSRTGRLLPGDRRHRPDHERPEQPVDRAGLRAARTWPDRPGSPRG